MQTPLTVALKHFFFFVKQAVLHYYYFFCSAQIALTGLSQLGTVLIWDTLPACREYITFFGCT